MKSILEEVQQNVEAIEAFKQEQLLKKQAVLERHAREQLQYVKPFLDMVAEVANKYPHAVRVRSGSSFNTGCTPYPNSWVLKWYTNEEVGGGGHFQLSDQNGVLDSFSINGDSERKGPNLRQTLIRILTEAITNG